MSFADSQSDFRYALYQVRQASQVLSDMGAGGQSQALQAMAKALERQRSVILEANTLDLEASLEMAVPERVLDWLKLTPERLASSIEILRRLAALGDPRVLSPAPSRLMPSASSYGQMMPLGWLP